jgi:Fe-S-cluster-containing dehydrogenase component
MSETAEPIVRERVILDMDRCVGCRSCAAACFYSHRGMPNVAYGVIREGTLPVICRQCEDPACVEACPVDALRREPSGVVRRSRMLCIGCGSCVHACPFGVIHPDLKQHQVAKCDMCEERVLAGGVPHCVSTCTSGALRFENAESLEKNKVLLLSGRTSGEHAFRRR